MHHCIKSLCEFGAYGLILSLSLFVNSCRKMYKMMFASFLVTSLHLMNEYMQLNTGATRCPCYHSIQPPQSSLIMCLSWCLHCAAGYWWIDGDYVLNWNAFCLWWWAVAPQFDRFFFPAVQRSVQHGLDLVMISHALPVKSENKASFIHAWVLHLLNETTCALTTA